MKTSLHRSLAAVSSLAMLLALGACDRADERTVGERMDSAGSRTERAAADTRRDARDAMASAGAAMDRAVESTRSMGAAAADKGKSMAAAIGDKVDDASITAKVNAALAADKDLSAVRIDVDTQNGIVTLSGPAPSASAKEHASAVARNVQGVTSVNNQLTVTSG